MHGGNIYDHEKKYGRHPIDFSASLNPYGMNHAVKNAAKTVDDYSFEVAEVSPDGPDDWVSHDPSLKEQLIEAKEQLTLLKAQLVELDREERKGKGR